jgi:hypothetical protein
MDARTAAARFAAFVWYQDIRAGQASPTEAGRFARENWTKFLPVADEGWGKLLLRVASKGQNARRSRRGKTRRRSLATVS